MTIYATSSAAFTVEFPFDEDQGDGPLLGPNGIWTRMAVALSGGEGREWVFPLHEESRRNRILYVFREEDRAEVTRRFGSIGIRVPSLGEVPR